MYQKYICSNNCSVLLSLERTFELLHNTNLQFERSAAESFSPIEEKFLLSSLLVSIFVGTYFKCGLYQYMYDAGKELLNQSINLLLLIGALIDHLICILMVANYTVALTWDIVLSDYIGEGGCYVLWYAASFGVAYRVYGSLGIAILRLVYIKLPYPVSQLKSKRTVFFLVLTTSIVASTLITIGFGYGTGEISRKQANWNFCTGTSERLREMTENYSLLNGTISPQAEFIPKMAVWISMTGIILEFACYLIFFHHLFAHDEGMRHKQILPVNVVKKRHRKNAITFFGQFYGFVAESMRTVVLLCTMTADGNTRYRILTLLSVWIEFGILAVVEVMTSQELRTKLPHNRYFKN